MVGSSQARKHDRSDRTNGQAGISSQDTSAALRLRFRLLSIVFALAILLLVGLSLLALELLSATHAYVRGESLYAKAQKQAVIAVLEYASTGRDFNQEDYRAAVDVLRGDRQARIALDRSDPDLDAARQGFVAGGNDPRDIPALIRLFRMGRNVPAFREAIEIWEQADEQVIELEQRAGALIEQVAKTGPGSLAVMNEAGSLAGLDRELTELEARFTTVISRIARQVVIACTVIVPLTGLLLIVIVVAFGRRQRKYVERADRALRESEQRYRALVDRPNVGMWQIDADGNIVYFNPGMRALLELDSDEPVEGTPIDRFVVPADRGKALESRRQREHGDQTTIEVGLQPKRGEVRRVLVQGAPIMPEPGQLTGHVGTCVDVTERMVAEEKLRYLAYYDPLTELGNRRMFTEHLQAALKRARRHRSRVAVTYIDLDRFKVINDAMGHATGDRILREAARRLRSVVRGEDTVARLGGDEFGMIIEDVSSRDDAAVPAQRIIDAFDEKFNVEGLRAHVGVSVGIAISDGADTTDLLRQADIAMYAAKRDGGRRWQCYDPEFHAFEEQRLGLESGLWEAAARDELVLHYQPIVELESGRIMALEALVRWQHPEHGLLGPGQFVPLAEETGAIVSIGDWLARRTCLDLRELRKLDGWPVSIKIAINVSDAEFRHADPVERIRRTCRETGIDPADLQMEATESLLAQHPEGLRAFKKLGCAVSIDDFGTGYASLDRLRDTDFDSIKIDRSFVHHLPEGRVDRAIVESIIQLGRRLERKVIAEGVETRAQRRMLLDLGCGLAQGFLFAKPVPKEELARFIIECAGCLPCDP